ncbi:MAG: YncE family protein [Planctomycetota bacterium]
MVMVDLAAGKVVRSIHVPAAPTGLALGPEGRRLYVTCAAARSTVAVIDTGSCRQALSIPVGHTAMGPAISPDGKR